MIETYKESEYSGTKAENYEAKRQDKPVWQIENDAIERFVVEGPVLDVPVGTGRYIPIYDKKGFDVTGLDVSVDMIAEALKKKQDLDYSVASIHDMPYDDGQFETAVCTRLLNWLTPVEMRAAVEELRRVAKEVVLSIRLGDSRRATSTMTHPWEDFLPSLNGWWMHKVELLLNEGRNGNYYMIAMRRPTWQDVEDQFRWNQNGIQVLADEWCERYKVEKVAMEGRPVRCQYMTGRDIYRKLERMAEVEPRLIDSPVLEKPARNNDPTLPIVWLSFGDRLGQVDGRHRARHRRNSDGFFPVFVVDMMQ